MNKWWILSLKLITINSVTCEKHFVKALKLKNTALANIHTFIELLSNLELWGLPKLFKTLS